MNKKIKTYCALLAIVFAICVFYTLSNSFDGVRNVYEQKETANTADPKSHRTRSYYVDLKAKDNQSLHTVSVQNTKKKQEVRIIPIHSRIDIDYTAGSPVEATNILLILVITGIGICILAGLALIPFLFISILRSIFRNHVISSSIISNVKWISWILIAFFLFGAVYTFLKTAIAKDIIELADYDVVYNIQGLNYSLLIIAFIGLIFAEVLHGYLKVKEEQDLTI